MATINTIAKGLRIGEVGGSTNDIVSNWLKGLGMQGALPDMLYSYLRSLGFTGALSDMLSRADVQSLLGRVLINLESTAGAYYELSEAFAPTGDFEVEFDFSATNADGIQIILGKATSGSEAFILYNGNDSSFGPEGSISVRLPSVRNIVSTILINDSKLHTVRLLKTGDSAKLYIDGVFDGSVSGLAANVGFGFIGKNSFGNNFNGIISNVKLTDLSTPANSLTFGLNELTQNFELAEQNVFGAEEVVNGDFPVDKNAHNYLVSAKGWIITDGGEAP